MTDDQHVTDQLPGLALGIVELRLERRLRAHISRCAECRQELAALEDTVGTIALGLAAAEPPAGLEERIMARVPARRWQPRTVLAAVAAVLMVVLAAGNVAQWLRAAPREQARGVTGFTTVVLVGVNTAQGAFGTVVLDGRGESGVLAMRDLPRLDTAHQYQLWLIRDGDRRSGGVFSVDEEGYGALLLKVPADFRDFTSLGISIEPAGGSPGPTGARVAAGKL
jgi:anti-sigma-K factor RskA